MKKKAAGDMAELVDVLRANPKFRGVDCDKLQLLLEQCGAQRPGAVAR